MTVSTSDVASNDGHEYDSIKSGPFPLSEAIHAKDTPDITISRLPPEMATSTTTQASTATTAIASLSLSDARPAIPSTPEDILATSKPINRSLATALKRSPIPSGKDYGNVDIIKQFAAIGVPRQKVALANSRPEDVLEEERFVDISSTDWIKEPWRARCVVAYPKHARYQTQSPDDHESNASAPNVSPLIILFHGGGNCIGIPESELPLARLLVQQFHAVVVLPSYRFAPENPFPCSGNDTWEITQTVAAELCLPNNSKSRTLLSFPLAPHINISPDPAQGGGFIVGGTSAGANHACGISFLARNANLQPPLTGQYLSCGAFLPPAANPSTSPSKSASWNDSPIFDLVPEIQKYRPVYLSQQQNQDAPILDPDMLAIFRKANAADYADGRSYCFSYLKDKPLHPNGDEDEGKNVFQMTFGGLPPAYFQVAGMDLARDDSLVYERILREEGTGVRTRLDLYRGLDHAWWAMPAPFSGLDVSRKRMGDAVEGIGWLLGER